MLNQLSSSEISGEVQALAHRGAESSFLAVIPTQTKTQVFRMFRDPRVLNADERTELIEQLRQAVALMPELSELRVVFGMALAVDLQAQEALEQLRTAARRDPNCFMARLKLGEMLMRLRICDQAAEETKQASLLATNAAQSELARRQASTIRTMLREGMERGGYKSLLPRWMPFRRRATQMESIPTLASSR